MSKEIVSKSRRVTSVVIGAITMIVLIALLAVLVVLPGSKQWVDAVAATDDAIDQTVSPTQTEAYCPAPMGLADTGSYGIAPSKRQPVTSAHKRVMPLLTPYTAPRYPRSVMIPLTTSP